MEMINIKKYKIGYTQGTFDLFHIGHFNLLKNAKSQCEKLIVGINSDQLVAEYKNKITCMKEQERAQIMEAIKYVDEVIIVNTLDKVDAYKKIKFDAIFIGDDWKGNERWAQTEKDLKKYNVDVVYLPHTDGISTTMLKKEL